ADGSIARHYAAGWQLRARAGEGADVNSAPDDDEPDKPTCITRTIRRSRIRPHRKSSRGVSLNPPRSVGVTSAGAVPDPALGPSRIPARPRIEFYARAPAACK